PAPRRTIPTTWRCSDARDGRRGGEEAVCSLDAAGRGCRDGKCRRSFTRACCSRGDDAAHIAGTSERQRNCAELWGNLRRHQPPTGPAVRQPSSGTSILPVRYIIDPGTRLRGDSSSTELLREV